ncbi:hypothetical protein CYMTET_40590 [Cymbomonas tetramitiformis]|uniref:Chromo domain-containing protein n=1 Tax=Cymbomonas tetramitiformis TaxID=36881 RepID=A0AAE0C922_9CHLO|nr:hypothetical protein CYMTET_40590 [Cymbomonas tetramitiformis]
MGARKRSAPSSRKSEAVKPKAQGKGTLKSTHRYAYVPAGSDDTEYHVREIISERGCGKHTQWLIGWVVGSEVPKFNTWEPIENLAGCEADIAAFRERAKTERAPKEAEAVERRR